MTSLPTKFFFLLTLLASGVSALAQDAAVTVGPGSFKPFFPMPEEQGDRTVAAFRLDRFPVTNAQFRKFVEANPEWRRGRANELFVDESYLRHWQGDLNLGAEAPSRSPVTYVSWFAAKAYCTKQGGRLPSEDEWEFAAIASETKKNGANDADWRQKILNWYARPQTSGLAAVGQGEPNYWGVYDLHGLVWEWVYDFNNGMVLSDNRSQDKKGEVLAFCGSGALTAEQKDNYASFMRFGFRSSLAANYTSRLLGFRCAYDLKGTKP